MNLPNDVMVTIFNFCDYKTLSQCLTLNKQISRNFTNEYFKKLSLNLNINTTRPYNWGRVFFGVKSLKLSFISVDVYIKDHHYKIGNMFISYRMTLKQICDII